jgi:MFS family permease
MPLNKQQAINTVAAPEVAGERSFWRHQTYWLLVALGFVTGGVYNFLPVAFPVFQRTLHASFEELGRVEMVFFLSGLVFSAAGGWLVGRLGFRGSLIALLLALAASLLLIAGAPTLGIVLLGAFCFGFALQGAIVVGSAMVSATFPATRQSVFFAWGLADAAGASLGPAAFGWWLTSRERQGGWTAAWITAAAGMVLLAVWSRRAVPAACAGSDGRRGEAPEPIREAQPDVGRVGGLTEARRVCDMAADRGRLIVPHCWKTGIGIAASAHLSAATAHCPYIEFLPAQLSESRLRRELVIDELKMIDGQLSLPQQPGLGIELNPEAIEKYEVKSLRRLTN